jgi:hypothetical protein
MWLMPYEPVSRKIYQPEIFILELGAGAGPGAPAYFAGAGTGAGKLRQKLRQTKLWKIISYFHKHLALI